ncbi:MAG: hypothetical protein ACLRZ9_08440 [Eubacterium sp.]
MMGLLVFKEKLKNFYAEHEFYLKPVLKFLASFLALVLIKFNIGYMSVLNMWPVMLGISVLFAFIPWGMIIVGLAAIITVNVFELSAELAVLMLISMLIMLLLFFRFTPREGAFLIIIPMAFFLKIPYVIPIAAGLICTPVSIVSVACGTVIYFMIKVISDNAVAIRNISSESTSSASINSIIDMIGNNREMTLTIVAFTVTIIVVYLIKRASVNNAWTFAILTGGIVNFVILLVGSFILNTQTSILWLIVGTVLSILLACILQFFVFSVDYSRTEHTQFEDDEYYYYVKAVPKINVTAPEMNVKRINAQRKRKTQSKKSK